MTPGSPTEKLKELVSQCSAAIFYDPRNNEVDVNAPSFPLFGFKKRIVLPFVKNSDPFVWASKCTVELNGLNACVFIPGRKFDLSGTRHGRGGGWYDRFLSKVPPSWLRIGVALRSNISDDPIDRMAWDEPVDWVLVNNGHTWFVHKTNARN